MVHIGVVFSFMWSQLLDCYHFYFLTILKKTLTFVPQSNPVLQYCGKLAASGDLMSLVVRNILAEC